MKIVAQTARRMLGPPVMALRGPASVSSSISRQPVALSIASRLRTRLVASRAHIVVLLLINVLTWINNSWLRVSRSDRELRPTTISPRRAKILHCLARMAQRERERVSPPGAAEDHSGYFPGDASPSPVSPSQALRRAAPLCATTSPWRPQAFRSRRGRWVPEPTRLRPGGQGLASTPRASPINRRRRRPAVRFVHWPRSPAGQNKPRAPHW